jgi:hypothetical protein
MSLRQALSVVFTVILLGPLATGCTSDASLGEPCSNDTECKSDLVCGPAGVCEAVAVGDVCISDGDCESPRVCTSNLCTAPLACLLLGVICDDDDQCCSGNCSDGLCN